MQRLAGLDRLTASPVNYWGGIALDTVVAAAVLITAASRPDMSWPAGAAAVGAGAFVFSFYEYAGHRWLYHQLRSPGRRIHGRHHAQTRRAIGAPFFFSLGVAAASWTLAWPVVGAALAAVFAGTLLGAFAYQSVVHHLLHRRRPDDSGLFAGLRRHHQIHHRRGDVNFGLTTAVWDRIFGTDGGSRR